MSVKIMPISDLRREASRILEILGEEEDAVYITHYGRPVAVMVDYDRYEAMQARLQELTKRLAQAQTIAERPIDYTARLSGLHREVWDDVDTDAYLRQERDDWER